MNSSAITLNERIGRMGLNFIGAVGQGIPLACKKIGSTPLAPALAEAFGLYLRRSAAKRPGACPGLFDRGWRLTAPRE
jgi:hypothetical protein